MSIHTSKPNDNELAQLAYASVASIPTVEANDRNRLGYHVWLHLRGEIPELAEAVKQARSRFKPRTLTIEEVTEKIQGQLAFLKDRPHDVAVPGEIPSVDTNSQTEA